MRSFAAVILVSSMIYSTDAYRSNFRGCACHLNVLDTPVAITFNLISFYDRPVCNCNRFTQLLEEDQIGTYLTGKVPNFNTNLPDITFEQIQQVGDQWQCRKFSSISVMVSHNIDNEQSLRVWQAMNTTFQSELDARTMQRCRMPFNHFVHWTVFNYWLIVLKFFSAMVISILIPTLCIKAYWKCRQCYITIIQRKQTLH